MCYVINLRAVIPIVLIFNQFSYFYLTAHLFLNKDKFCFMLTNVDKHSVIYTKGCQFSNPTRSASNSIFDFFDFQLSRIVVESKTPTWQKADLRMTRVKDTDKGELLIFKELSWQTVRIEAKSTKNEDLTPLRLITNQARWRNLKNTVDATWETLFETDSN